MKTLKIMSFNMRTCHARGDGDNIFENRKELIKKVIEDENPDIIGFQEITGTMRSWIKAVIGNSYTFVGCGRNADYDGEGCPVAFRSADMNLTDMRSFWLSDTPEIPGSRFENSDQSRFPRICSVLRLSHREISRPFRFYNTHLDHTGAEARGLGLAEVLRDIEKSDESFILTGDFNAKPDYPEMKIISRAKGRSITEATEGVTHTFHAFGKFTENYKIDYIFTDAKSAYSYAVEDKGINGIYISDHFPVCAGIELE